MQSYFIGHNAILTIQSNSFGDQIAELRLVTGELISHTMNHEGEWQQPIELMQWALEGYRSYSETQFKVNLAECKAIIKSQVKNY